MYYYYEIKIEKNNNYFEATAPAFPQLGVLSRKRKEDATFAHHFKKLGKHWNKIIEARQYFPKFININDLEKTKKKGHMYIGLNPMLSLKVMVHHAMLDKGISRAQLAKLIAISPKEWDEQADSTSLQKALLIKPKALPQYQRVKRVLDIFHPSKLLEVENALRCLDLQIHLKVVDRNPKKKRARAIEI